MNHPLKRLTAVLIILILMLGLIPAGVSAQSVPLSQQKREYGYQFLSADCQQVYDIIKAGISSAETTIKIPVSKAVNEAKTVEVVEMLSADHPELFWFGGNYQYSVSGQKVVSIIPSYEIYGGKVTKELIDKANVLFQNAVSEIIGDMKSQAGKDDYSKAVWLHDRVAQIVTYRSSNNDQTAYGALVDGKCVCAGYARAYQYLLQCAGIQAWTVLGTSYEPNSGRMENHAWNVLWIQGKCIYTDVTWDDQDSELYHLYFGKSLGQISADHIADQTYYASKLPVCNCTDMGYFEAYRPQNDMSAAINAQAVADLLTPKGDGQTWTAVLYAKENTLLDKWLSDTSNLIEVLQVGMGEGSYSLSYSQLSGNGLDKEVHLVIQDNAGSSGVTMSGSVKSYLDNEVAVTLQLIQNGTVAYTTESLDGSYSFSNVVPGTYTLRASKHNHAPLDVIVVVEQTAVNKDVKLCPMGDLTGDGKVNMKDWSALYDHINEVASISGYALACGDVNQDGKVNMKDWSRLYEHISETAPLW